MIELNLIPDVKLELLRARRQQATVISMSILVTIIAGGIVTLLALYVFGGQELLKFTADTTTKSEMQKLTSVKDLSKTLTVQQQIAAISSQQDQKLISSRLFDVLNATIPTDKNKVSLTTVNIDAETKTITLEGQASNGYEALEVFKKTIAGTKFSYLQDGDKEKTIMPVATEISDSERSYGESSTGERVLRFKLALTYPDELFASTTKSISINPPQSKDATDSTNSVPTSLFTDPVAPPKENN